MDKHEKFIRDIHLEVYSWMEGHGNNESLIIPSVSEKYGISKYQVKKIMDMEWWNLPDVCDICGHKLREVKHYPCPHDETVYQCECCMRVYIRGRGRC